MTHFRQLFEALSSSYTYLLADAETRDAVVIDAVREQGATVLAWLDELNLALSHLLETHVHENRVTVAADLKARTGARVVLPEEVSAACADVKVRHADKIVFGNEVIRVLGTPGHTPGCVSYLWRDRVFTGDALLIGGCGRTDFRGGDAGTLYNSITCRLFVLPGETLVYPAHDYRGRTVSTIAEERERNPRLAGKSRDEFITLMSKLDLPRPAQVHSAVPANRRHQDVRHAA
ncbi:MAG: MBL fold metallo-hydrolase [Burkholderiales bacterium]